MNIYILLALLVLAQATDEPLPNGNALFELKSLLTKTDLSCKVESEQSVKDILAAMGPLLTNTDAALVRESTMLICVCACVWHVARFGFHVETFLSLFEAKCIFGRKCCSI